MSLIQNPMMRQIILTAIAFTASAAPGSAQTSVTVGWMMAIQQAPAVAVTDPDFLSANGVMFALSHDVAHRLAVGVEVTLPTAADYNQSSNGYYAAGQYRDNFVSGVVHVHLSRFLDAVAGASLVTQHLTLNFIECCHGGFTTGPATVSNAVPVEVGTTWGAVVGVDGSLTISRLFSIVPAVRLHFVQPNCGGFYLLQPTGQCSLGSMAIQPSVAIRMTF